ncbi:MAG: hypothetical protein D6785_09085 [Planctomycetota bacterium]|nr:MAG: hypothetical protein D6785_09085 [Planctomycetota bacterium]
MVSAILTVTSRNDVIKTHAGIFKDCIRIDWKYPGLIGSQNLLLRQWFAPNVGLVRYTIRTLLQGAGTIDYYLYQAIIGMKPYPNSSASRGVQVSLSLNRYKFTINRMPGPTRNLPPVATLRFTLANNSSTPITMRFNSGNMYDIVVRDSQGQEVWRWSKGKYFITIAFPKTIKPGEKWTVNESFNIDSKYKKGAYTIEFYTTAVNPGGKFSSKLSFLVNVVY